MLVWSLVVAGEAPGPGVCGGCSVRGEEWVGAAGGQHQDWVYTATGALRPRALAGSCCWLDTLLEPHTPPTLPSYKDDLQLGGENFTPFIRAFHDLD